MSLADLLKKPPSSPPADPVHSLRVALGIAQSQTLPRLETEHRLTALLALGEPENEQAQQDVAKARDALQACQNRIADLEGALREAETVQETRRVADVRSQFSTQCANVKQLLVDRDAAGARLADALDAAAEGWRSLKAANRAIEAAWPIGVGRPNAGTVLGLGELKRAVAGELHRLTGDSAIAYAGAFPGAAAPNQMTAHNPKGVPTLTAALGTASANLTRILDQAVTEISHAR